MFTESGLGIYERKKESKKTRKHALVQENTHGSTKKRTRSKKHALDQENVQENTHSYKKDIFKFLRNINQFYFQQLVIICRFD